MKAGSNNKFGFLVSDLWFWLELLYSFNLVQSSLNVIILSCMRSGSPDSWFLIWILVQKNNPFLKFDLIWILIHSQKVVKSKRSGFLVSDFVISVEIYVHIRYGIVKF